MSNNDNKSQHSDEEENENIDFDIDTSATSHEPSPGGGGEVISDNDNSDGLSSTNGPKKIDQIESFELQLAFYLNDKGLLSSDDVVETLVKPIFNIEDFDKKVSLLKQFQKWFKDMETRHEQTIKYAKALNRDTFKYEERFIRMKKVFRHYEPLAQDMIMEELERRQSVETTSKDIVEDLGSDLPNNDRDHVSISQTNETPPINPAAQVNRFSGFNIIRPPKMAAFDINNDDSLSPTKDDSILGMTFNKSPQISEQLANSQMKSNEPSHSTPKEKGNGDKKNEERKLLKSGNSDDIVIRQRLKELRSERESIEEELRQLVKSPFFDPNEASIKRREERIIEIIEQIDNINEMARTTTPFKTTSIGKVSTTAQVLSDRIAELKKEYQLIQEELDLRPDLMITNPDNECIRRRLGRQSQINKELSRLRNNLQCLSNERTTTVSKDGSRNEFLIRPEMVKKALELAKNISIPFPNQPSNEELRTEPKSKGQRTELERQQHQQLSQLKEMVSKLENRIGHLDREKKIMARKINELVLSASFDAENIDFIRKAKELKGLNGNIEELVKELESLKRQQNQVRSTSKPTQSNKTTKNVRIEKHKTTSGRIEKQNDNLKSNAKPLVAEGDNPPSDPDDSSDDSSSRDKPPKRNNPDKDRPKRGTTNGSSQTMKATTITNAVQGLRPNINKFDGNNSDAALWMRQYISATKTMRWDDTSRTDNFSTYLTGAAQEWYKNHFNLGKRCNLDELLNPQSIPWKDVVKAFYEKYLGKGAAAKYIDLYNNFKPDVDEDWSAMCQRYRSIADMAYPQLSDEDKIKLSSVQVL